MYLVIFQDFKEDRAASKNRYHSKEVAMIDEAFDCLEAYFRNASRVETRQCCFWNDDDQYVETEWCGWHENPITREEWIVWGWIIDQEAKR